MQSDGHKPTPDDEAWNDLQQRVARAYRAVARGTRLDAGHVRIPRAAHASLGPLTGAPERTRTAATTSSATQPRSARPPSVDSDSALARAPWMATGESVVQEGDAVPGTTELEYRAAATVQPPSTDSQIPPTRLEPDRVSARGKLRFP